MRWNLIFFGFFLISLVSATIQTHDNDNSFGGAVENSSKFYNFSVDGLIGNTSSTINKVEAILEGEFSFVSSSNGASVTNSFSISGGKLTWSSLNAGNGTKAYFWFNATSSKKSGEYFLNVKAYNSSGVFEETDIGMDILDTIAPNITIVSPEEKTYDSEFILVNVTINEKGICQYSSEGLANVSLTSYKSVMFTKSVSFDDGKIELMIYCSDNSDNWASKLVGFRTYYEDVASDETQTTNNTSITSNQSVGINTTENKTTVTNSGSIQNLPNKTDISSGTQGGSVEDFSKNSSLNVGGFVKILLVVLMSVIGAVLIVFLISKTKQSHLQEIAQG